MIGWADRIAVVLLLLVPAAILIMVLFGSCGAAPGPGRCERELELCRLEKAVLRAQLCDLGRDEFCAP